MGEAIGKLARKIAAGCAVLTACAAVAVPTFAETKASVGEPVNSAPSGAVRRAASFRYTRGSGPNFDQAFPFINNRRWTLTVPVTLASDSESGTIISQGGYPFGWGLYLFDGKPAFLHVNQPQEPARLEALEALGPGRHEIEISMVPEDSTPAGPARLSMRIDGGEPVSLRVERTVLGNWNSNGVGIGRKVGMLMLPGMEKPFAFTGAIGELTFDFEN